MQVEFERELMAEKREQLTKLLLDLMEKKQKRAEDLQVMMQEMEVGKAQDQENYWLIQYQKLLDSKPASLTEAEHQLDTQVSVDFCVAPAWPASIPQPVFNYCIERQLQSL